MADSGAPPGENLTLAQIAAQQTAAMQAAMGFVGSGMAKYALSIGMDTAQGRPGDALEYTAAAGGAAVLIGPADEAVALINSSYSFVTDTPDFWRRAHGRVGHSGARGGERSLIAAPDSPRPRTP